MTDRTIEKAVDELAVMVGRGFQSVTESMATKGDLKAYATKEDLTKVEKRLQGLQGGQERILEAILGVPSKENFERFETRVYDHEKRINALERKTI